MVKENLQEVEKKIEEACRRAGRNRSEVTLIAVSKTKPVSMLQEAYSAGIREFGENKVQEMMDKYDVLPDDIHWHMIGHLQRNKVKYLMGKSRPDPLRGLPSPGGGNQRPVRQTSGGYRHPD